MTAMPDDLITIEPANPAHLAAVAQLWTAAAGPSLTLGPPLLAYGQRPLPGVHQAGRLYQHAGRPVGAILVSAVGSAGAVEASWGSHTGWIELLAVAPAAQRSGIGGRLLTWALDWLADRGARQVRLGGGPRPCLPGLPVELATSRFFLQRGFRRRSSAWDTARDLRHYRRPPWVQSAVDVRPLTAADSPALLDFFAREFSGRWAYEYRFFLNDGGRPADYHLLWLAGRVEGFCRLTLADSERPLDRFYHHRLPQPWGQLGPIGVSAGRRGQGYGAALLDAGLRTLQQAGVAGCIIDWTSLLDFYGRFGFQPYRHYAMLLHE
jgi:predicted N-acetyltransferase YhbS